MKRSDVDWRYLGRHMLVPFVTAMVALLLLGGSRWYLAAQIDEYDRVSVDQDVMNADYDALVLRKRLVDRYHRRYERFQAQGFIGEESRLDWIETLRVAARDLKLPILTYSLEPQQNVIPPVPSSSADVDIQIYLSTLTLEIGLVHELDLLRLFDELQARAPGLIKVDGCTLSRQSEPDSLQAVDPNFIARCSLGMFSIVTSDVGSEETKI